MPDNERDRTVIEHMLRYCREIETAHDDFGHSRARFDRSTTYQNAVSMCILQIGELVNHLSEDFRAGQKQSPGERYGACAIMWPMSMGPSTSTWSGTSQTTASENSKPFARTI